MAFLGLDSRGAVSSLHRECTQGCTHSVLIFRLKKLVFLSYSTILLLGWIHPLGIFVFPNLCLGTNNIFKVKIVLQKEAKRESLFLPELWLLSSSILLIQILHYAAAFIYIYLCNKVYVNVFLRLSLPYFKTLWSCFHSIKQVFMSYNVPATMSSRKLSFCLPSTPKSIPWRHLLNKNWWKSWLFITHASFPDPETFQPTLSVWVTILYFPLSTWWI